MVWQDSRPTACLVKHFEPDGSVERVSRSLGSAHGLLQ